ncbi:protein of unknown function [Rhodovastum atsumiense]|nr:protein of unknown function [Rhodovastum atsumiense]
MPAASWIGCRAARFKGRATRPARVCPDGPISLPREGKLRPMLHALQDVNPALTHALLVLAVLVWFFFLRR